ncbi:hypothetical protein BJV82DRAFT_627078 [Fennellomyces sp. T-0311]|nr:hypothetical protein BJV82DRAFT_627078 [Fennellomyces sp. T-0311]
MNIHELLIQPATASGATKRPIHDDDLMAIWERSLQDSGYKFRQNTERNSLTDGFIWPATSSNYTPIHIKVIGRHMNGSFRCHIGTGKASRPIQSTELYRQMRLLAVFFKAENSKSQLVSPEFIFFPTWLLHLFRYTEHGSTPGRTDVRFLENAMLAKEDHIYRLNNVLNTLFRFNLHDFNHEKLRHAVDLANFLFDTVGLHQNLPRPDAMQPIYYGQLVVLLQAPRPSKLKPMCHNCNTKPASRRRLCVACYRYQLKHGEPRPLRLIVANRPGPRVHQPPKSNLPVVFYSPPPKPSTQKYCANCGVHETHQWYRNLCGAGHWCETCKSYYLRHTKVRPAELFVKAAKRKVDVRTLVNWWPTEEPSSGSSSPSSTDSSIMSSPTTPPPTISPLLYRLPPPCASQPLYN